MTIGRYEFFISIKKNNENGVKIKLKRKSN